MRYILQIVVMLSDIAISVCSIILLSQNSHNILFWLLVLFVLLQWKKSGGFEAWHPKTIKQFLKNAKEAGL